MSTLKTDSIREYLQTQPVQKAWLFGSFSRNEEGTLMPFAQESANQDKILIYERQACK